MGVLNRELTRRAEPCKFCLHALDAGHLTGELIVAKDQHVSIGLAASDDVVRLQPPRVIEGDADVCEGACDQRAALVSGESVDNRNPGRSRCRHGWLHLRG